MTKILMCDYAYVEKLFAYKHLPEHLQSVSKPFHNLALNILKNAPNNPERTIALRDLLTSKDAAVRATVIGPLND